jgi:hypothetical protein
LGRSTSWRWDSKDLNDEPKRNSWLARSASKHSRIRDLDPATRERASSQWLALQSRFVDDPTVAVTEADALVTVVMQTRGYPIGDFTQRAADISVDHPRVVTNYRSAHEVALRLAKGEANTEDLRTAMIHYRSLFEELVLVPTAVETREVA